MTVNNIDRIAEKFEITGCGRSHDIFVRVPKEIERKHGLNRGDQATVGTKESNDSILIIYEFKKEKEYGT